MIRFQDSLEMSACNAFILLNKSDMKLYSAAKEYWGNCLAVSSLQTVHEGWKKSSGQLKTAERCLISVYASVYRSKERSSQSLECCNRHHLLARQSTLQLPYTNAANCSTRSHILRHILKKMYTGVVRKRFGWFVALMAVIPNKVLTSCISLLRTCSQCLRVVGSYSSTTW